MTAPLAAPLAPCPFCRATRERLQTDQGEDELGNYSFVQCMNCGAKGPCFSPVGQAIAAWNLRPAAATTLQPMTTEQARQIFARVWVYGIDLSGEDTANAMTDAHWRLSELVNEWAGIKVAW